MKRKRKIRIYIVTLIILIVVDIILFALKRTFITGVCIGAAITLTFIALMDIDSIVDKNKSDE